jgi:hypothetical protein
MIEMRTREHQPVDMGDADAGGNPSAELVDQPARDGAVQNERIAVARIQHRDHEWLAVHAEADMRDHAGVQNRVDGCMVVVRTRLRALHAMARLRVCRGRSRSRSGCHGVPAR